MWALPSSWPCSKGGGCQFWHFNAEAERTLQVSMETVVVGDFARSARELRVCSRSLEDAVGNDADRIEFDQAVRRGGARAEGPEQTEQFAQLGAIHQAWWGLSRAAQPNEIVPAESLATMHHDHAVAVAAPQGPPALTTQAWHQGIGPGQCGQCSYIGVRGHVVDQGRDEARGDRSSRSSANITPAVIPEDEVKPKSKFPPAEPIQVTVQTLGTQPAAGAPQSYGPTGGGSQGTLVMTPDPENVTDMMDCGQHAEPGWLSFKENLCKLAADAGLFSVEVVAMLGDTAAAVKESIKTLVPADALGATDAARELSLMQLAAAWHACHALQTQFATRRAKMEEDPSKVPEMAQEDHAEFMQESVRS
eukprot:symbB.v1.2.005054.t1/scaffold291.1/size238869/19